MEIPDDAWKSVETTNALLDVFSRHVIGLYISCDIEGSVNGYVYSGILVKLDENLFFLTAGHVIERIKNDINKLSRSLIFRWIEGECKGEFDTIPATISLNDLIYINNDEYDFGFIKIDFLSSRCLIKDNKVTPVERTIWQNTEYARPDFYYLLGMPAETNLDRGKNFNGTNYLEHETAMYCFPVELIPFEDNIVNKEIFHRKEDYYGKIYLNINGKSVVNSIVGMSGGPLFSIEYRERLIYRLYGILESWDESKQIIRVQSIKEIVNYFINRIRI